MAQEIFSGSAVKCYYNTDTGNSNVIAPGNIEITSIAKFPEFSTGSQASSYETYDSEYQERLLGDSYINDVEIVVNYIPDNQSHQFLDTAYDMGQIFQLNITYNEDDDLGKSEVVILNGQINGRQINGGRDDVVTMSYTFTASSVVSYGTRDIAPVLRRGDYGVGSNGSPDYPQYAPDKAEGNSFVKITGSDTDNPAGTDLYGIELVSGESTVTNSNIMITDSGELRLYARNNDSGWQGYYSGDENDGRYLIRENNLDDLGDVAAARTNLDVYSKGESTKRFLQISNNLSELPDVAAARTKLEIYSKQEGDARYLQITNNLSELTDVEAARTKLDVYSKSESDNLYPLKTYTINTKPLSGNIVLTPTDIGALELTGDKLVLPGDIESTLFDGSLKDYIDTSVSNVTVDAYTREESDLKFLSIVDGVSKTIKINGHALSADIVLTNADLGLGNVLDETQLTIGNNLSDVSDKDIARSNIQAAKNGVNSDITGLISLSGSLKLGGDAVSDYDAVTLRQARNLVGSGSTGPTLNGVMNYGVGTPMMAASRAYIQPYDVALDGQLLKRGDYPELWNFAQMVTPIDDSVWLADPSKRGMYSLGDGTTTFRVPDWNGVQSGSIPAVFFRGGVGAADMTIADSGLPNLTGNFRSYDVGGHEAATGAFYDTSYIVAAGGPQGSSGAWDMNVGFDASRQWSGFGRSTTEVRPRAVSGVWVVRANGGFTATNTYWSVINGDATAPPNGTIVNGGDIISEYKVGTTSKYQAKLSARAPVGSTVSATIITAENKESGTKAELMLETHGLLTNPGNIRIKPVLMSGTFGNGADPGNGLMMIDTAYPAHPTGNNVLGGQIWSRTFMNDTLLWQFGMYNETNVGSMTSGILTMQNLEGAGANVYWRFDNNGNALALNGAWVNGASDIRVKKDFKEIEDPYSTMRKIKAGTWRTNIEGEESKFGIGVLANGLYDDYPEAAIYRGDMKNADGVEVKDVLTVQAGDSGVLAAVHHSTILKLMDQIEVQQNQIDELKSLVQSLLNNNT